MIKYFLRHGIKGVPPISGSSDAYLPSKDHTSGSNSDNSGNSNGGNGNSSSSANSSSSSSGTTSGGPGNSVGADCGHGSRGSIHQQQPATTDTADLSYSAADASSKALASAQQKQASSSIDDSNSGGGEDSLRIQPVTLTAAALAADGTLPLPSGASSPTAASEHSIATATSTSSAVPFSHIAQQRRQQAREEGLQEASQRLLTDAAAAFSLRMQGYNLDLETLQQLNDIAAERYSSTAEVATALGQFVADLETRQAAVREALAVLPQLDRQLRILEGTVGQLDKRSKDLESKLGLGKSSTYDYLASTLSRAGNSVTAAAQYAASGGVCLGGEAMAKE